MFFSKAMAAVRVCVAVIVAAQETCHTNGKDLCKCTTDSGITLDLRKVGLPYPAQVTSGDYQYTYTPCDAQLCGEGEPSAACQQTMDQTYYSLARFTDFSWTVTNAEDPDNLQFDVSYGGGDIEGGLTRSVVVQFSKTTSDETVFDFNDEDTDTLTYLTFEPPPDFWMRVGSKIKRALEAEGLGTRLPYSLVLHIMAFFTVEGKGVAASTGGGGGGGSSGGTIAGPIGLVIIFLALGALVAYFIVGGVYLYKRQGARGMEVIPQYTFWKELPFLIKDGFFFTISPCYKREGKYQGL